MWDSDLDKIRTKISQNQIDWLQQPFKLHPAYERICDNVCVEIIREAQTSIFPEETQALQLNENSQIYVREIFIRCDNERISFARTAMPLNTYQENKIDFLELGTRLLGKTMLYDRDYVERGVFSYNVLYQDSPYYQLIESYGKKLDVELLSARRSVFYIHQQPLLITEIFLPNIPQYIPE